MKVTYYQKLTGTIKRGKVFLLSHNDKKLLCFKVYNYLELAFYDNNNTSLTEALPFNRYFSGIEALKEAQKILLDTIDK